MITVKDNYLSEEEYQALFSVVNSENFPWYFNPYRDYGHERESNLEAFQFVHIFYHDDTPTSSLFNHLKPLLSKIKHNTLVRIKLNLNPYSQKLIVGAYHRDKTFKCKGAIYYLNTNNGYTLFEKGKEKTSSVKN